MMPPILFFFLTGNFKFHLILINLNSYMWLVTTVVNSIGVEVHSQNLADHEIKKLFELRTSRDSSFRNFL